MNEVMAERIRLLIDTDAEVRLAVKLASVRENISPSQLVNRILRKALTAELADARKYATQRKRQQSAD